MSAPPNVISIEDNAEFLLNTDSNLNTDENISRASIYQLPKKKKYKKGYQPLLGGHTQKNTKYLNCCEDEEDVLLNPTTHRQSTMSSIGGQPTDMDNESVNTHYTTLSSSAGGSKGIYIIMIYIIHVCIFISLHILDRKGTNAYLYNNEERSTPHWTSIFLHFHSVERDIYIYPCVMIIGMLIIIIIMFIQLFFITPTTLVFCRYLNWMLIILFVYIIAFVISYSKVSTKKWCLLRDYLYVIFWINSIIGVLMGIFMEIPFSKNKHIIKDNLKYINCSNNDYNCKHIKKNIICQKQ